SHLARRHVARAFHLHVVHGQGRAEPEPGKEPDLDSRDHARESPPDPVHVRFAQRSFRARPHLAAQRFRALQTVGPGCAGEDGAATAKLHKAGGPTWRSWRPTAWSTSRWHSSSKPIPAARAASGSSESSVRPGTVLTSSTHGVPAASTMTSTRAMPEQPSSVNARSAASEAEARAVSGMRAGMMWCDFPAVYFAS